VDFFEKYFPDAIDLIGKESLIETYFSIVASPLVSIKVRAFINRQEHQSRESNFFLISAHHIIGMTNACS